MSVGVRGDERLLGMRTDIPECLFIRMRYIHHHAQLLHALHCSDAKWGQSLVPVRTACTIGEFIDLIPCQHRMTDAPRIENIQKIQLIAKAAESLHT